jgi:acetyltransferase-like isoleucine patch superfamily enzyme
MPPVKRETIEIQKALFAGGGSKLDRYCDLIVGTRSRWALVKYELVTMAAAGRSGALGLWLRAKLYPRLLAACGRNVTFGKDVVLRHPHKIAIGDNVVVDDHVVLDAKGVDNAGIRIGSGVFIGRGTILSCKNGDIVLGDRVNIGFNCEIFSANRVEVGASTLLAAYTYLIGGDHDFAQSDVPVLEQGRSARGITVGTDAWLGAGVKVLDGTTIGAHAIVGTGAVVNQDVADYAIAVGVPARVVRDRRAPAPGGGATPATS